MSELDERDLEERDQRAAEDRKKRKTFDDHFPVILRTLMADGMQRWFWERYFETSGLFSSPRDHFEYHAGARSQAAWLYVQMQRECPDLVAKMWAEAKDRRA